MAELHRDLELPFADTVAGFRANLAEVRDRIDAAARRAGRDPHEVRLLPVSKTVPEERLVHAVRAGSDLLGPDLVLGENKVQEAERKWEHFRGDFPELRWAVIGHLQTNKAKDVARFATELQTLDSAKLAETLQRRLDTEDRTLDVFLQVNTSGEEQKSGVAPEDAPRLARDVAPFDRLRVRGLMTLAIFSGETDAVRACFRRLVATREQLRDLGLDGMSFEELSMGMSGDYELAIEEGATTVRVGTAIFGRRPTPDAHYWPADGAAPADGTTA